MIECKFFVRRGNAVVMLLAHTHVLLRLVVAFPPEKPVHLLASFSRPNFASLTSSKNNNNPRLFLGNSQKSTVGLHANPRLFPA